MSRAERAAARDSRLDVTGTASYYPELYFFLQHVILYAYAMGVKTMFEIESFWNQHAFLLRANTLEKHQTVFKTIKKRLIELT